MPDIVPNVSHTVVSQQAAIDGGRMDYPFSNAFNYHQAPSAHAYDLPPVAA